MPCFDFVRQQNASYNSCFEVHHHQVGARLDNVYLDKELAGRIQQIQVESPSKKTIELRKIFQKTEEDNPLVLWPLETN